MFPLRARIARRLKWRCIERGAWVRGEVKLGRGVYVASGAQLVARRGEKIVIGDNSFVLRGVLLYPEGGSIRIGANVGLNPYCVIYGHGGVDIGDDVLIATSCVIIPANHGFADPGVPIRAQPHTHRGIRIENNVWLGARVTVLDGVTIGSGAVIGAGAVVTRDIPPAAIAAGVPARVIRRRGEPGEAGRPAQAAWLPRAR